MSRFFSLNISEQDFAALSSGSLNPNGQQALGQWLHTQQEQLNTLPLVQGLVSPNPYANQGNMEGIEITAGSSAAAASVNLRKGSLLEVLPCTRTMKTHAKNLLAKLTRLRVRLVNLGAANTLEKQKKYFQFRLVSIEDIDSEKKQALDRKVGEEVLKTLVADVDAVIKQCEEEQLTFGEKLQKELVDLSNAATA